MGIKCYYMEFQIFGGGQRSEKKKVEKIGEQTQDGSCSREQEETI